MRSRVANLRRRLSFGRSGGIFNSRSASEMWSACWRIAGSRLSYASEIEKRVRPHLRMTNGSWRVDETYIKVKGRRHCSTLLSESIEVTARCEAENDHGRQEPHLSKRGRIDEESGRVVALCAPAPGQVSQQYWLRSSGGKERLGGISKRGDGYIRRLLVHGARAIVGWRKRSATHKTPWIEQLLARRPTNVATVAYANKLARIAWAIMMHGNRYNPALAFATIP
jgi:Transposase IS116/IS110/IS902 family